MKSKKKNTENSQAKEPIEHYGKEPLSFEKVWLMFQETDKQFKETDKKLKESDKMLTERFQETDKILTKKFQETDKILTKKFQETDKILTKKFQETDKRIKELSNLFTSQWGKLVESLVEGTVIKIFREAGIEVHYTSERVSGSYNNKNFEFDIFAHNETDLVVIEVKTTLRPKEVKDFLLKLKNIKTWIPLYRKHRIRGCVAFLTAQSGSDTQAQNAGLYALKATGDSAHLINPPDFEPKIF